MKLKLYEKVKGFIRFAMYILLPLAGGGWVGVSCTDTWDDHYDSAAQGVNGGSLWQAIKADANLSNFATVIEATGYDKSLGSNQVFTVFVPTNDNFSAAEAAKLVEQYREEKKTVNDEDNTVIKEFVQNHIALYNHSVASTSNDSIVMMNKKYAVLKNGSINSSNLVITNKHFENGVLFTVDKPVDYSANIFEYIRKDADLDSVRSFLYNPMFYKKEFSPGNSVEGGLDSLGRTVYLDSVFYQSNELYSYLGRIASEDSTYWMVLPTNEVWRNLVEEYSQYFVYSSNVANLLETGNLDSLSYTNTRIGILQGATFSQTSNYDVVSGTKTLTTPEDSVRAFPYIIAYNFRESYWGAPFNYFQFYDPLSQGGVFYGADRKTCSNGAVLKQSNWPIDKLQTFARWKIFEAESGNLKEIGKTTNTKGELIEQASGFTRSVQNVKFRDRVWSNRFVEFVPNVTTRYSVTYNITGVLSNLGYDIFVVTAPALANDSNATANQSLPTRLSFTLNYPDEKGKTVSTMLNSGNSEMPIVIKSDNTGVFDTTGDKVDYLLLAEDFKFPTATFGLNESEPSITLVMENRTLNSQVTRGTHQRTTRIDCILLVPHGTLQLVENLQELGAAYDSPGVLMMPHGQNRWQYLRLR